MTQPFCWSYDRHPHCVENYSRAVRYRSCDDVRKTVTALQNTGFQRNAWAVNLSRTSERAENPVSVQLAMSGPAHPHGPRPIEE